MVRISFWTFLLLELFLRKMSLDWSLKILRLLSSGSILSVSLEKYFMTLYFKKK